jgi:tetratricopeptide (TPR) repeat protein
MVLFRMLKFALSLFFIFEGIFMPDFAVAAFDFDTLWNYSKPSETEQKSRALIPIAEKSEDPEYLPQLLTQIARTQSIQKKFVEAHQILDQVKAKLSSLTPIAEIRYLLEKGRTFNTAQLQSDARPLFENAYNLSLLRHQDNYAIDAAHMTAITEPAANLKMEWNLKALSMAESSQDPQARDWKGSLYNNIGWTYHDQGNYEAALDVFKKSVKFRETKNDPEALRIAKWSVARTERSLKNYDEALKIQLALEKELNQASEKDGYVYEEIAEIYLARSESQKARHYFSIAYFELSKDTSFAASEPVRLERLRKLGQAE